MYLKIGMEIHVCPLDILGRELHVMKDQEYVSSHCELNSVCFYLCIMVHPHPHFVVASLY